MYTTCLPPVLEELLSTSTQEDTLLLEIQDEEMLRLFFVEKIIASLLDKQSTLVVIPDGMSTSIPSQILSKQGLGKLVASLSFEDKLDNSAAKIKELLSNQEIPMLRQEYQNNILKKRELVHKIHNTLLSINKGSVHSPSFKKMLLSIKMRPRKSISESLIERITSIQITSRALEMIRQLQGSFKERFVYMDQAAKLSGAHLEDAEALQLAREGVSDLYEKASGSLQRLEKELWLKKRVITYEVEEEVSAWMNIKEELQSTFLEYDHDSHAASFSEKGMPIIKKLEGYKYLKIHIDIVPELGWGQVNDVLHHVTAIIDRAQKEVNTYFHEYTNRLSPYSTGHPQLDQSIQDSLDVIKEAQSSKYLSLGTQQKFLQVSTILEGLRSTVQELSLANKAISDEAYVKHKLLAAELNLDGALLQGLYQMSDQDWSSIIEFYGQRSHLMAMYTPSMSKLGERYNELKQTQDVIRHHTHKEVHNRWYKVQREVLGTLKNEKWDIYKNLCDGGECSHSSDAIYQELQDDLIKLFPVQIVQLSDKRRLESELGKYDNVFFLDHKHLETDDVSKHIQESSSLVIASSYTVDLTEVKKISSSISHYSAETFKVTDTNLVDLESSERYKVAMGIANNVTCLSRPLNLYKKNDKVIIVSADDYFNHRVVKMCDLDTQHVLYRMTKDPAHVLEVLLHYDNIHIILENGLLNDQTGGTPLWQRHVVKQMRHSGIKVHSVETAKLYQNMTSTLHLLREGLGLAPKPQVPEAVEPKQQVLSFVAS